MSLTTQFNQHIETFKEAHAATAIPTQKIPVNKTAEMSFLNVVLHNYFKLIDKTQFDYGLDSPYRIYSCLDPIIQYLAVDLESQIYICWNEDEKDGIHPAKVMQRLLELQGMETDLEIDNTGESSMTIFHNGKITKVKDNHDSEHRQITIDGRDVIPDKYYLMDGYFSMADCIKQGVHLTDCDDDGFCNYCGENTPLEEAELSEEEMSFSNPGYKSAFLDEDEPLEDWEDDWDEDEEWGDDEDDDWEGDEDDDWKGNDDDE